jgi:uncharacterized protein YkwD
MPISPFVSHTAARVSTGLRRRLVTALTVVALAATLLLSAAFTSSASAAVVPHTTHALTPKLAATYARNMLVLLNKERALHHERALTMNTKLILSAHRHNLTMSKDNTMSHQLPGEAFFADRISRTGYKWRSAGENIGWNSDESNNGLLVLEREMYAEKAPNNGHRLNILNKNYRQVGIDVYFDAAHGKMWFTQDFGQPA